MNAGGEAATAVVMEIITLQGRGELPEAMTDNDVQFDMWRKMTEIVESHNEPGAPASSCAAAWPAASRCPGPKEKSDATGLASFEQAQGGNAAGETARAHADDRSPAAISDRGHADQRGFGTIPLVDDRAGTERAPDAVPGRAAFLAYDAPREFRLFAARNATVIVVLLISALSLSGAIFIILEMNHPLTAWSRFPARPCARPWSIWASRDARTPVLCGDVRDRSGHRFLKRARPRPSRLGGLREQQSERSVRVRPPD